ncbi:TIGR03757 family integrating conjugative element protein [Salmonella enterica]|nr:TIGR03757 family integrating conjugative element protein [Salmonella enterica]EJA7385351.1 TIGR03757 family integrating conjugative element protein [Salmonella enterica]EJB0472562.1 TIGR03757 family integrating conjugative element protein [Salmonella enterica]EJC1142982.1 TIGR03757 family integrating conjugative element protein [Salmonella enterica]EJC1509904.1 TIGR03757 family integrating conjugative element protein [Salmonella enterica]
MKRILSSLILISSFSASAQIVVYTDQQHPPVGITPAIRVVYLDASERWQQQQFGELSSDPAQAVLQAQAVLNSPVWKKRQKELVGQYRGMIEAWQIGLKKYPAVVFDNRDVVYGTADISQAVALRRGENQ